MEEPTAASPQPLNEEPESKKLKPAPPSSSDGDDVITTLTADVTARKPRYKRRKVAIFFAYCGVGYQGMQKNPGAKTIEGDLEEALYHSGAVPEHDRGAPKRFDWARSARTDKGVSAVGQVVSGRFYVDPPGFVDRLNSKLPGQIRIFGYKRVTDRFSAKKFCDRRRYVYLIPVFALDPSAHRDRESVLASLGSGSELVKCLECSERGRKVAGAVGKGGILSNTTDASVEPGLDDCGNAAVTDVEGRNGNPEPVVKDSGPECEVKCCGDVSTDNSIGGKSLNTTDVPVEPGLEGSRNAAVANVEGENANAESMVEDSGPERKVKSSGDVSEENLDASVKQEEVVAAAENGGFCYGEKERERFNRILKYYVGTHNFHNFTSRTKAEDPSAQRYIISFDAETTLKVDGIEFVKCEVVGQSFMLHQIRKMVGLAVAIMRDCAPESLLKTALRKDINITIPTAPEVGLYLEECFFSSYNEKWNASHEEISMKDYEEAAEEFKVKHIYTHIAAMEHKEGAVGLWLHSLNYRNYPDLRGSTSNGDAIDGDSALAEGAAD